MKKLLFIITMLACQVLYAQEGVNIKFIRPSKFQGSAAKVRIIINDNEYILKNGSEISVIVPHDYSKPLLIEVSAGGTRQSYRLRAIPSEKYVFETGFETFKGIYLKHLEGKELAVGEVVHKVDTAKAGGETTLKVDKDGRAVGFTIERIDESEAIRQEWLSRGGRIKNESVLLTGTYFGMNLKDFDTRVDGYGGGISAYQNWINLKIPEFKSGISTWNSFNYGWGIDMLLYRYKLNMDLSPSGSVDMSVLTLSYPISANLGWTFGIGKFLDQGNWKGVALTLKYKPSVTLNMVSTTSTIKMPAPLNTTQTDYNSDTNASFNLGGFGVDFEFSNFTATMNKLAPMPKTKFSFFVLPPVGDTPMFISVSLGISWYSR